VSTTAPDPKRLELQALLETLLGSPNAYFQPPSNKTIQYPCIVYAQDNAKTEFAGNLPYSVAKRYQLTVIDRNPDTDIPNKVAHLRFANFNRAFTADNLHHYVYNLYF
jgi:hypothetical protein